MRTPTQEDLNAAARGLGMLRTPIAELQALVTTHKGKPFFASAVIAAAAEQIIHVKQFNNAS